MDADSNGNGHAGRAASNALKLDASVLTLVAKERNLSLPQLLQTLAGTLLTAAEAGDVNAARELQGYVVAAWLGRGATSSGSMFRRIKTGMRRGLLSLDAAVKATKLVQVQRELETSDLDRRLRALEQVAGTAIRVHVEDEA